MSLIQAKVQLDTIIKKSRVHLYKPIQIAEILYHHRNNADFDLLNVESYRNRSKKWRDSITARLVGRVSTSSQKFQDNLFEQNALPPALIVKLAEFNEKPTQAGCVEAYIYRALQDRLNNVNQVSLYVQNATAETFSLAAMIEMFEHTQGLRRSIDKMYEISVYALFSTLVRILRIQMTLEINNRDQFILQDFAQFISAVIGIQPGQHKITLDAALYRVGVTNAADRGLDMWSNFGAAIQVKHLTLNPELVESIADSINADRIVIVCLDAEQAVITTLLNQVGWSERIQGIITLTDLIYWYNLCLNVNYKNSLGQNLLQDLYQEFTAEFPLLTEIMPFMQERDYDITQADCV